MTGHVHAGPDGTGVDTRVISVVLDQEVKMDPESGELRLTLAAICLALVTTACGDSNGIWEPPPNQSPTVSITTPSDGSSYDVGHAVNFQGSANDPEDGSLSGNALVWLSDQQGQIGTGTSLSRSDLSAGVHKITLEARDSKNAVGAASISVAIVQPQFSGSWSTVSAGGDHTCAIDTNDRAFCWGMRMLLGAGQGGTGSILEPSAVLGDLRFRSLSAARRHTCGLTLEGVAYCWGTNSQGQLGNRTASDTCDDFDEGSVSCSLAPLRVANPASGPVTWRSIAVGSGFADLDITHFTCAVTTDDELYCWGDNSWRQFDGSDQRSFDVPELVGTGVFSSSLGGFHMCLTNRTPDLFCSGRNRHGQLGLGDTSDPVPPSSANWVGSYRSVATGESHSCAIQATAAKGASCWGANSAGQLGRTFRSTQEASPQAVDGGLSFALLTGGDRHTCGLTTEQVAYCWGGNSAGQLGNGAQTVDEYSPFPVVGGLRFDVLDAGRSHTCGVTTGGELYCWGSNYAGQLGDGGKSASAAPQEVAAPNS